MTAGSTADEPDVGESRLKVLVAGWFSFEEMGATAGDLLALDLAREWLEEAGCTVDVAMAPPFAGGLDWRGADPAAYAAVVFVCGPFGNGWPLTDFLERFAGCQLIGLNLSMLEPLERWNPFDLLLERDSSEAARPDLAFLSRSPLTSIVGVVLAPAQKEYVGGLHEEVQAAVERVLAGRDVAAVRIDTRLDRNDTGLRSPRQVESLVARMDAVITTRLHGMVLALKHGVPVVAVDPVPGGAKVLRQAQTLGWPVFRADQLTDGALGRALDEALGEGASDRAAACRDTAVERLGTVRETLTAAALEAGRAKA